MVLGYNNYMELFTIAEMAKRLKIPPSTASYYIKRHSYYMAPVGSGRKKRYKKQTLEALKAIVEGANDNKSTMEIEDRLSSLFSRSIEVEETTTAITTTAQQQQFMEVVATSLNSIADQKNEIQELKEEVKELRKFINKYKLSWWQRLLRKDK